MKTIVRNNLCALLVLAALLNIGCSAARIRPATDINPNPRIVSGQASTSGQFPYYVLLLTTTNDTNGETRGACGGSLIYEQWILTAAHCVANAQSIEVHLGALRIMDYTEPGRIIVRTNTTFTHPHYFNILSNDIALVRLNEPVESSSTIQTIRLPTTDNLPDDTSLTAIGFGKTKISAATLTPVLQHAEMHTISRAECQKTFPFLMLRQPIICARGRNLEATCVGDSGGPLARANAGQTDAPSLIGITSFGSSKGCNLGLPSAFTHVYPYLAWIHQTIITNTEISNAV